MAFDRLRSPQANSIVVGSVGYGPSAYADNWSSIIQPYTFVGESGITGTTIGVSYRCHMFEWSNGASYNITFSRAGAVDLFIVAGGGGGGGARQQDNDQHAASGGGGGGGGVILEYGYGVNATTYTVTVGNQGAGAPYYDIAGNGGNSVFASLTAVGGGQGGVDGVNGYAGGSGGGAGSSRYYPPNQATNRQSNPGNGTAGQGFGGGVQGSNSWATTSAGGGGFSGFGLPGGSTGGRGGHGLEVNFDGTPRIVGAGGGGGGGWGGASGGLGGSGVGGNGATGSNNGNNATSYGNGGGGGSRSGNNGWHYGGSGSPGLVIIRYAIG